MELVTARVVVLIELERYVELLTMDDIVVEAAGVLVVGIIIVEVPSKPVGEL